MKSKIRRFGRLHLYVLLAVFALPTARAFGTVAAPVSAQEESPPLVPFFDLSLETEQEPSSCADYEDAAKRADCETFMAGIEVGREVGREQAEAEVRAKAMEAFDKGAASTLEARREAHKEAFDAGYDAGWDKGWERGWKRGEEAGRREGYAERQAHEGNPAAPEETAVAPARAQKKESGWNRFMRGLAEYNQGYAERQAREDARVEREAEARRMQAPLLDELRRLRIEIGDLEDAVSKAEKNDRGQRCTFIPELSHLGFQSHGELTVWPGGEVCMEEQ